MVAASTADPVDTSSIALKVQTIQGDSRESGYHLNGQLINGASKSIGMESGVATLFDTHDRVIGFRAFERDQPLAPGAGFSFDMDIIPQTLDAHAVSRFEIVVDGR